jgi:hypothetical protein
MNANIPGTNKNCMQLYNMQSMTCLDYCGPLTPNGCDCFGCCEVHASDGSRRTVRLTDTCTQETLDDEAACVACVQSTECVNDCGTCELCLGKTTLPPECYGTGGTGGMGGTGGYGGTGQMCSNGGAICNENMPCPPEQFCLTGCCVEQVR